MLIARTGSPWRELPERYPNWRSVYTRWRRWVQQALWSKILALLTAGHDPESYAVDETYVRVHAHRTRARGNYLREAIGRSRDGLTKQGPSAHRRSGLSRAFRCDRRRAQRHHSSPGLDSGRLRRSDLRPRLRYRVVARASGCSRWLQPVIAPLSRAAATALFNRSTTGTLTAPAAWSKTPSSVSNPPAVSPHATIKPSLASLFSSPSPASSSGLCDFEDVP